MCLIGFALDDHPRFALVLAANRDELFARPAAAAGWWPDAPDVFGGRDLDGGGSWLAVSRRGRVAAVTNYRQSMSERLALDDGTIRPSRGRLVNDFVTTFRPFDAHCHQVETEAGRYAGFNLLLFSFEAGTRGRWIGNRANGGISATVHSEALSGGVHGVSNAQLDTPWPKVRALTQRLQAWRTQAESAQCTPQALTDDLLQALADRSVAPDAQLPDTGVGLERERWLSAALIVSPDYGTRASTVLLIDHDGSVWFTERTYDHGGAVSQRTHRFDLTSATRPASLEDHRAPVTGPRRAR